MQSSSTSPSASFLDSLKREVDKGSKGRSTHQRSPFYLPGDDTIPQDTVVYELYDTSLISSLPSSSPSPPAVALRLDSLRSSLLTSVQPLLSGYLWHHEPFDLQPSVSSPSLPHLRGSTHFGECLDDGYFLTSLLLALSASFPALLVHVRDADGYFLLIDAADALPLWAASPEGMEHRAWLSQGRLRLLPERVATRDAAVRWLMEERRRGSNESAASEGIQAAIAQRMAPFPVLAVRRNAHRARCLLPLSAIRALRKDESVLNGAVEAFHTRDLLDTRVANRMQAFLPSSSPSSPSPPLRCTVLPHRTRFTYLQFVQLTSQPFALPRALLSHPCLAPFSSLPSSSPYHGAFSLGVKVLAGLEMYLAKLHTKQRRQQEHEQRRKERRVQRVKKGPMTTAQIDREMRGDGARKERWKRHLNRLTEVGWFDGTVEGDALWQQQLTLAWVLFGEEEDNGNDASYGNANAATLSGLEVRHLHVLEGVLEDERADGDRREVDQWVQWEALEADDDDSWLRVDSAQVDATFASGDAWEEKEAERANRHTGGQSSSDPRDSASRTSHPPSAPVDDEKDGGVQTAQSIVSGVRGFLSTTSSHEGAELPCDARRSPVGKPAPYPGAQPKEAAGKAERMRRLMAVLAADERGIEVAIRAFEADFGAGCFESDLLGSVGELHLEGEDAGELDTAPEDEEQEVDDDDDSTDEKDTSGDVADEGVLFGEEKGSMRDYFASMAAQLRTTGIGDDFERRTAGAKDGAEKDEEEEEDHDDAESDGDVDEDLTLLKNMLQSMQNQEGLAGPAGNLLGALGIRPGQQESQNALSGNVPASKRP